ncbi:DUF4198 domain-containing protein [Zavarzinella formosa]|uniref:DUF4198 domain-containing protein n=1 Tax=Zavarzinella formosa TaxID=360055 RepID=UPI0002FF17CC|nr:DUF4198 domain-containing protein [Zavarzinella formosa]
MRHFLSAIAAVAVMHSVLSAHDTWVQTNTNLVRTGDAIHIDLMLGNHGNEHRDFKLAGKVTPEMIQTFDVTDPTGKKYDLKSDLADLGYAPKEGFHSAKFSPAKPGVYVASHTSDKVVNHGKPTRSYRSAKVFFLVSDSLDKVAKDQPGFAKPLGHQIELVPETSPLMPMGPGTPIKLKLLFAGKPAEGVKVSFIPRGVTLKEGTDAEYERTTDKEGRASFTPKTGNYYLIAARIPKDEKGDGFESTVYTATLTVFVPEKCPCCGE